MKTIWFLLLTFLLFMSAPSQNQIPDKITSDLVLKPQAKPYTSTGFTLEKGATLTILPGVKIMMSLPKDVQSFQVAYARPSININGTLVIGTKGAAKAAPVVLEGSPPRITFNDAKLDVNNCNILASKYEFKGENSGTFSNVNFFIEHSPVLSVKSSVFTVSVPKTGSLSFLNCLIDDQGIAVNSDDFPNDIDRLNFTKCAFTSKVKNGKLSQHFMPITMFAYGNKCDCHVEISYKAFNWPLKKALATEWFISDERARKTTADSAKSLNGFSLKLANKPLTQFKQEVAPPVKDDKK